MLDVVTVTGADDGTRPEDLVGIAQKFPFVELGVLVGDRPGTPRFPSAEWRDVLCRFAARNYSLHLSCHLCGRWVENFLTGDVWIQDWFGRHQINTHGQPHDFDVGVVRKNVRGANLRGQQVVFQYDGVNTNALLCCLGRHVADRYDHLGVAALYDRSHGAGILPATWERPLPGVYTGYAGGLSPDNVAGELDKISALAGDLPFWIDAETHLRTDDGRHLDLDRVDRFLEAVRPYVRSRELGT
jgi:hypothetical protein